MPRTKNSEILERKDRVKAATDLRGVPEGTEGRVLTRVGLDWIRYWVSFENGVDMGSLGRDKLVRVKEWDRYLVDRQKAAEAGDTAPETSAASSGPAEAGDSGGGVTIGGVVIPQLLLDRTKAALERRGVNR